MTPASPPAPPTGTPTPIGLFRVLAHLVQAEGAHIAYAHLDDDAHWDATTRTLTLNAAADEADHTYALGEFYRRLHLGPAASRFTEAATRRHLHAVT